MVSRCPSLKIFHKLKVTDRDDLMQSLVEAFLEDLEEQDGTLSNLLRNLPSTNEVQKWQQWHLTVMIQKDRSQC